MRACLYEQRLLDHLVETREALQDRSWQPGPPVVFTVQQPKAREVYAAQFEDRVVHHWLVPQLDAVIDPDFIHDATSNRVGRGTHFAVDRLQHFMRQLGGKGYYLQLDIANFFNSIHQPTLLELLSRKLQKAVKRRGMPLEQARLCYQVASRIVRQPCAEQAIRLTSAQPLHNRVPAHKRLENAPAETGLPIGNLTSQFMYRMYGMSRAHGCAGATFANLYLNELDQFVKHTLKCRHYVRYVDDFVLLHPEREKLVHWQAQIAAFLRHHLRLEFKSPQRIQRLSDGVDFLGYIVRPDYRLVRRRVVGNLHQRLQGHAKAICRPSAGGTLVDLQPRTRDALRATLASYQGHFLHANSYRLRERVLKRHAWLEQLFFLQDTATGPQPCWEAPDAHSLRAQWRWFFRQWPDFLLLMQCGRQLLLSEPVPGASPYRGAACIPAWSVPIGALGAVRRHLQRQHRAYLYVSEQGYHKGGLKRRLARLYWMPRTSSIHQHSESE